MSLAELTAAPIKAKIGGKEIDIYPATAYEIGICESSFLASLRRQAIESTMGLGADERDLALRAVAQYAAQLYDDVTPLYEWVSSSIEGTVKLLLICIETAGGAKVLPRDVGRWLSESGGIRPGAPVFDWMVRSGLRSDPTVPPSGEASPAKQTGSEVGIDTSEEPSSESPTV